MEWLRALLLAGALLLLLHVFVFRWVTVRSTSMFGTLLPGDLVAVQRWPQWTGYSRGDIVVFRDPLKDRNPMFGRDLLVKRLVGSPGDTVELRQGMLFVNGVHLPRPAGLSRAHVVRLSSDAPVADILKDVDIMGTELPEQGPFTWEGPLTEAQVEDLAKRKDVLAVERLRGKGGRPGYIFPYSPFFPWNADNYGPVVVPGKGMALSTAPEVFPLYDRLIVNYEQADVAHEGGQVLVNGGKEKEYIVTQDYVFVLGDARDHSSDSRFWGFVPMDHLVGRVGMVVLSQGKDGSLRKGRCLTVPDAP